MTQRKVHQANLLTIKTGSMIVGKDSALKSGFNTQKLIRGHESDALVRPFFGQDRPDNSPMHEEPPAHSPRFVNEATPD